MLSQEMMTRSSAEPKSRIGPVEQSLLRSIDRTRNRVWLLSAKNLPPGVSAEQARQAVHRLSSAGLLDRIERGTYLVHPRSGRVPLLPLDLVGAWFRDESYAVVGWAAAEAHDLTQQTASVVEVQLERDKGDLDFAGVRYSFKHASATSVAADNTTVASVGGSVTVASPGKVVVLLLRYEGARRSGEAKNDTRLVLDVLERGRNKGLWQKANWAQLVRRHGTTQVARRLGYLLDLVGGDSSALLEMRGRSGTKPFSPSLPPDGLYDRRWRLVINDPGLTR